MKTESELCAIKCESSPNVSSVEEFNQICRCCLSTENKLSSVFEVQFKGNSFSELLYSYTSVHVSICVFFKT